MAKRAADSEDGPHRKRPKITKVTKNSAPRAELYEVRSSRDLQLLLAFDQDTGPVVRQSTYHGRGFLEKNGRNKQRKNDLII